MIELPEATCLARQMTAELSGKRIESAVRGISPHKFAFYSGSPEEYESILRGKVVAETVEHGGLILTTAEPGYVVALGGGGERILFHRSEATLPAKHQFLLRFAGGTALSVTIQMWGSVLLLRQSGAVEHPHIGPRRVSPLSDSFDYGHFAGLFGALEPGDPRSIKYFVISKPGVWGVGNGYLQDILFRAKIHPRRRALDLGDAQRRALHAAIRETLEQATSLGGRDGERDLYDRPGGYRRILDSRVVGQPCPACGAPIQKIQYLGGTSYFCPKCQV